MDRVPWFAQSRPRRAWTTTRGDAARGCCAALRKPRHPTDPLTTPRADEQILSRRTDFRHPRLGCHGLGRRPNHDLSRAEQTWLAFGQATPLSPKDKYCVPRFSAKRLGPLVTADQHVLQVPLAAGAQARPFPLQLSSREPSEGPAATALLHASPAAVQFLIWKRGLGIPKSREVSLRLARASPHGDACWGDWESVCFLVI